MKIIITGATGFIGKSITDELSKHHTIIQFSSKTCDITKRHDTLKAISKIKDIDCIIHTAGTANIADSYKNPRRHKEINVGGTKNILESCMINNIRWIVYASSASVYSAQGIIKETDETKPKSPYGQSKLEAENLIKKYHEQYGIDCTILRYFNIYGKGETTKNNHIVPSISKNIYTSTPIRLTSTGGQERDFINIVDIAKINKIIIEKKIKNKTINIGTGTATSINHIIAMLEKEFRAKAKIDYVSTETTPDTVIADIGKLRDIIADYAFMDIDQGLKEYVNWFINNETEK